MTFNLQYYNFFHISGNDALHSLTLEGTCELRIDMKDFGNVTKYALYQDFSVADGNDGYRLSIGAYSGTAGKWRHKVRAVPGLRRRWREWWLSELGQRVNLHFEWTYVWYSNSLFTHFCPLNSKVDVAKQNYEVLILKLCILLILYILPLSDFIIVKTIFEEA